MACRALNPMPLARMWRFEPAPLVPPIWTIGAFVERKQTLALLYRDIGYGATQIHICAEGYDNYREQENHQSRWFSHIPPLPMRSTLANTRLPLAAPLLFQSYGVASNSETVTNL
jgi:hypothetical protein